MKDEEGRMGIHGIREKAIARRAWRRVFGERASVMFEFAIMTPFIVMLAAFAADFTRILRTEQQLEIAARLGADVEAHMADFHGGQDCPSREAKTIAKTYLVKSAQVQTNMGYVYMKGEAKVVRNPVSYVVAEAKKFLDGEGVGSDNWFVKLLGKVLGGIANLLTFGTFAYVTDVMPHDRQIQVSMAASIPTILPKEGYEWFGWTEPDKGRIGVWQCAYDLDGDGTTWIGGLTVNPAARHRVYCVMPVMDSAPIASKTYVRVIMAWLAPILRKLGVDI